MPKTEIAPKVSEISCDTPVWYGAAKELHSARLKQGKIASPSTKPKRQSVCETYAAYTTGESLQASNDTAAITGAIEFAHLERRCPMNDEEAADFDAPTGICEHDVVTACLS